MPEISESLKKHFLSPQRQETLKDPDGIGIVGNTACGDIITFFIKVEKGTLKKVRFQSLGCGAAKAVASFLAELAEGRKIEEIENIKIEDIFKELKGLPENKWHCPFQALDALKIAIRDYERNQGMGTRIEKEFEPQPPDKGICPECKAVLGEGFDYCTQCKKRL